MKNILILYFALNSLSLLAATMKEYFPEINNVEFKDKLEKGIEESRQIYDQMELVGKSSGIPVAIFGFSHKFVLNLSGVKADRETKFALGLLSTYKNYCDLLNKGKACLGSEMFAWSRTLKLKNGENLYWYSLYKKSAKGKFEFVGTRSSTSFKYICYSFLSSLRQNFFKIDDLKWNYSRLAYLKKYLKVNFYVLQRNTGLENRYWLENEGVNVKDMLSRANKLFKGNVGFIVSDIKQIKNTSLFNKESMDEDLSYLYEKITRKRREISVLISNQTQKPIEVNGQKFYLWGLSHMWNRTSSPYFCMRRGTQFELGTSAEKDHTARIFLHELGHSMMLLGHGGPINTDNYYFNEGVNQVVSHVSKFKPVMYKVFPY